MRIIVFILGLTIGMIIMSASVNAETEAEKRTRIENELQVWEQMITTQKQLVDGKKQERQSLERDLDILDAEVNKAQLGIKARALAIAELSDQISDKVVVIEVLNDRLAKQRASLGELIRQTQAVDDFSLVEIMLSNQNFSEFFTDVESFRSVKQSLNESLDALAEIKADTEDQKESLEEKQLSEAEMKQLQEQEKIQIEEKERKKESILHVTRGQEDAYVELLQEQQKTAAQLRAQLFDLSGGGGAIPFPEAVAYAQVASGKTGVSAALILAILEQESHYGSNIGQCTATEIIHGKAVMHPTRDWPIYKAMADHLGFNVDRQAISCPWIRSGERIGWGGAMGPSQFIPSTWAIYGGLVNIGGTWTYVQNQDAIRTLLGKSGPSSPFVNQDAFLATALLMRDNGAAGTYNSEWTAAIRYFAGWAGASNPINHPYGDNVMTRKARLESEIKILQGG